MSGFRRGGLSRRGFMRVAGSAALVPAIAGAACAAPRPSIKKPLATGVQGLMMVYTEPAGQPQLRLFDTQTGRRLTTFEGLEASHAIVPVESHDRFVIHGRSGGPKGEVWVIDVDPEAGTWSKPRALELGRGMALHWQPNRDQSLIQFNTVGDGALHVLNTETLEIEPERGGGNHSNMAFFDEDRRLVATDHLGAGTTLRVIDRASGKILSQTEVGTSGHGVTVNDKTGTAFVWADDGVHMVDLSREKLGQHLGVLKPHQRGARSWFCWTPQGGRYSHDYTWNPGDTYSPWLSVLDMEKRAIERIPTPNHTPGILQISPEGKRGLAGSLDSRALLIFDIASNRFEGSVEIGRRSGGFFDRDLAFSKDRRHGFATNPGESTVSVVDLEARKELGRIEVGARPIWMKVLT